MVPASFLTPYTLLLSSFTTKDNELMWVLVLPPEQLSADRGDLQWGGFYLGLGQFMSVSGTEDHLSPPECKMMSCDSTCPAVIYIYLTLISDSVCSASGYSVTLVQEETEWNSALNIDFRQLIDWAYFQEDLYDILCNSVCPRLFLCCCSLKRHNNVATCVSWVVLEMRPPDNRVASPVFILRGVCGGSLWMSPHSGLILNRNKRIN